jgi:hypothetical protein
LSRGSSPSSYLAEPLVSYQINRQLSGWNLPPQVIRAFGAHGHKPTSTSDKHLRASMWFESVILLGVRELPVRQRLAKLSFSFWSALFFQSSMCPNTQC